MIIDVDSVKAKMPMPKYESVVTQITDTDGIMRDILDCYNRFKHQSAFACKLFNGKSVKEICKKIYEFCQKNIKYVPDDKVQLSKSPSRTIHDGFGDCKSISIFCASILKGLGYSPTFRFVSYAPNKKITHVYVICEGIALDPTIPIFNFEYPNTNTIDMITESSIINGAKIGFDPFTIGTLSSMFQNANMQQIGVDSAIQLIQNIGQLFGKGDDKRLSGEEQMMLKEIQALEGIINQLSQQYPELNLNTTRHIRRAIPSANVQPNDLSVVERINDLKNAMAKIPCDNERCYWVYVLELNDLYRDIINTFAEFLPQLQRLQQSYIARNQHPYIPSKVLFKGARPNIRQEFLNNETETLNAFLDANAPNTAAFNALDFSPQNLQTTQNRNQPNQPTTSNDNSMIWLGLAGLAAAYFIFSPKKSKKK